MKNFVLPLVLAAIAIGPAAAQAGKLSVRNQTGKAVTAVHVSPIDVDRFGPNLLRGKPLASGGSAGFADLANGLYDMRVVNADGEECLLKDIDYFQYSIWTLTPNCGAFGGGG